MDTIKPLYTATATAQGGRNGHTQSSNGLVSVDLSVPKALGGPGKPGYNARRFVRCRLFRVFWRGARLCCQATQEGCDTYVRYVSVSIGPRDGGGFGLAVKMRIEDKSVPQSDLAALVQEAHEKICPYSHATRNNVQVTIEAAGG